MQNSESILAIQLALDNGAIVRGLIGTSYPNGREAHGVCRDIPLDLSAEQSAELLKALKSILEH